MKFEKREILNTSSYHCRWRYGVGRHSYYKCSWV